MRPRLSSDLSRKTWRDQALARAMLIHCRDRLLGRRPRNRCVARPRSPV